MDAILQIAGQTVTSDELLALLTQYQLLPPLIKEVLIDQAIAGISLSAEDTSQALEQFYQQHQLTNDQQRQTWLSYYHMTSAQLTQQAQRQMKLERFKENTWGHQLESEFIQSKDQFDQFIYSLIRTSNSEIAQELYFRLLDGEQSFAELAPDYSKGPEAQTGGLIGPVMASKLHPTLARMLANSQPGHLWPPTRLGDWLVLVRLEKHIPAQLNETLRRQLLNQRFEQWLKEQMQTVTVPMPPTPQPEISLTPEPAQS